MKALHKRKNRAIDSLKLTDNIAKPHINDLVCKAPPTKIITENHDGRHRQR